ncbi:MULTISPECIES: Nif3-like dinuclear metal center hexameric protein [unclassified Paludibacterium]|uniref:Nif3-like dinuclear metal center hexameric protein n=1 Tax=unclassified Paludibacterium TaxID=2618429 RepID=UPI001C05C71C|nr:Nif3-like dinuclear metal center hexameric protein [Paludibacterium sp. B53371]BEV73324.1 Nif3-like dinuclear metal center hexameric protein [Paludibacterium sp. THUN1379]
MQLADLLNHLDQVLEPWRFKDYCPNGLQVAGREEVRRVVCGVTASQALIDEAVARQADAVLVHHGFFWKGEDQRIIGMKKRRLQALLQHDISLLAYHLPLDAHPQYGNNAQLAKVLGLLPQGQTGEQDLLWHGHLPEALSAEAWRQAVSARLHREVLMLGEASRPIRRVAWCTGGAQGFFDAAIALGVDAFLTGEASEQNQHMAMESGCVFMAAGHHATERYGIAALGGSLADAFGIEVDFVDLPNPV